MNLLQTAPRTERLCGTKVLQVRATVAAQLSVRVYPPPILGIGTIPTPTPTLPCGRVKRGTKQSDM